MIDEYAEGQVQNRLAGVLGKLDNILLLGEQEFEKGEISGIKLFQLIPSTVIADLEERIVELEEELEYGEHERTRDRRKPDSGVDEHGDGLFEPPV